MVIIMSKSDIEVLKEGAEEVKAVTGKVTNDTVWNDRTRVYLDIETLGLKIGQKITLIGVMEEDKKPELFWYSNDGSEYDLEYKERDMLYSLLRWLHRRLPVDVVTYNGFGFDIPKICARCGRYHIQPYSLINPKVEHIDLLRQADIDRGMFQMCKIYNIDMGKKHSSKSVIRHWKNGDYQKLLEHNKQDLFALRKLDKRMNNIEFNE